MAGRAGPRPPSVRWYRLAILCVVAGALGAAWWWVHASSQVQYAVNDFARTSPFGGRVELRAGVHTFWIEGDCMSCRGNDADEYRAAATVRVTDPGGDDVALRPLEPPRLFNTGGSEGRGLWWFEAPTTGSYAIALSFDTTGAWDNRPPGGVAIGEGHGLPVRIVRPMVLILAGASALAAATVAWVWWRRRGWHRATAGARGVPLGSGLGGPERG